MPDSLFTNLQAQQLLVKYKPIWSLNYLLGLASWEMETYMPEAGAKDRGIALAETKAQIQKLFLHPDFVADIQKFSNEPNLNEYEMGLRRVLNKELEQFTKLPTSFILELEELTSESQMAWRKAKRSDDFAIFAPFLTKIIDLNKRKADFLGYANKPYDALLDLYEEGQKSEELDAYFAKLKPFLQELLSYVLASKNYSEKHSLSEVQYEAAEMQRLNEYVLKLFGADSDKLRLDISTHPFTQSLSANDVRITTWYHGKDFARSLFATIHEFGHALYELQCNPRLSYTPIGTASSLGLHESQSRFWENCIGRSADFTNLIFDQLQSLGGDFSAFQPADYLKYFNLIKPSLLRVEADELTYHFHIMIRYEIEKGLLNNDIKPQDLPEVWNSMYQKYLGIVPQTASEGILQDIHWSMGALGYFPTYSTGTVLSATWLQLLQQDLGNLSEVIKAADGFSKISIWLSENIHQYGSTYTFNDLLQKTSAKGFSLEPWMQYLQTKVKSIY